MTNKDQSKFPYDRSEYVVMPPIRKAEDGTLTTEPQKVDGFNPDWKCRPDCVAHEVMKEWIEYGHAPNSNELAKRILSLMCPPPIDVEALKREVNKYLDESYTKTNDGYENGIVTSTIDYLVSAGYFRAYLKHMED